MYIIIHVDVQFFLKTKDIDSLIQFKIKLKKRHKHIQ